MHDLSGPNGGITDEIAKWRSDWMANKDAIKKGGMAQQEHMAKLNSILRKVDQSKQRAKTELEIGKAKFEGKYDPDDDDVHVLDKIGRSIYDPESYKADGVSEYGWQDLSPSVPEFDATKQNQFWTTASRGLKPGRVFDEQNMRLDKTTGKAFVPFKEVYSSDQIKKIADDASDLVAGDRSARKHYNKILENPTSDIWHKLNEAYQRVYGKNKIVSTPEQAAQADLIIKASGVFDAGEQLVTDQDAAFQRRLDAMMFNSGLIAGRSKGKEEANLDDYDVLGAYESKVKPYKVSTGSKMFKTYKENEINIVPAADVDINDKKLIGDVPPVTGKDGTKYYVVREDGDWEGKKGQVISRAKAARANLDKTTISEVKRGGLEMKPNRGATKAPAKRPSQTFKIIDPDTGKTVGEVDSQEAADKAVKKGYKVQ